MKSNEVEIELRGFGCTGLGTLGWLAAVMCRDYYKSPPGFGRDRARFESNYEFWWDEERWQSKVCTYEIK